MPAVGLEKPMAGAAVVLQNTTFPTTFTFGEGFTVTVKVRAAPTHVFAVGITVTVPTVAASPSTVV